MPDDEAIMQEESLAASCLELPKEGDGLEHEHLEIL